MESLQSAIRYRRGKLGSTRMSSRHGGDGKLDVRFEQPDKWRTGNHQSRDTLCSAESEWHWLGETGAGYRQARSIQTCAVAESNGVDWRATCRATTFPKLTYFLPISGLPKSMLGSFKVHSTTNLTKHNIVHTNSIHTTNSCHTRALLD